MFFAFPTLACYKRRWMHPSARGYAIRWPKWTRSREKKQTPCCSGHQGKWPACPLGRGVCAFWICIQGAAIAYAAMYLASAAVVSASPCLTCCAWAPKTPKTAPYLGARLRAQHPHLGPPQERPVWQKVRSRPDFTKPRRRHVNLVPRDPESAGFGEVRPGRPPSIQGQVGLWGALVGRPV